MRALAAAPRLLTPLALAAAAVGLVLPSATLASNSDLLLALLVLATALGISFSDLRRITGHAGDVALLSLAPPIVLAGAAWLIGRPFSPVIRDGLLAVGLSSSEVASVGLVALAGADATIALGVVTGSLVVSAVAGPLLVGVLAGASVHASSASLLGRFALVVIAPLLVGVAVRSAPAGARIARCDEQREGVGAITVAVLVYAALSGTSGAHHLGSAALASAAFLLLSGVLAYLWRGARAGGASAVPGAMTIAMRDFAVAAALATEAFGASAGTVPGVYGVLMLVGGAVAAGRLSSRA